MTDLLAAFEHLGKVVRPTAWGNPVDLPAIRAELRARTGQPGTTDGPRTTWTYEYPDLDKVPDAIAACEALGVEQGQVREAFISRKLHPALEQIALKAVREMPQWKPGRNGGKVTIVQVSVTVHFQIK